MKLSGAIPEREDGGGRQFECVTTGNRPPATVLRCSGRLCANQVEEVVVAFLKNWSLAIKGIRI